MLPRGLYTIKICIVRCNGAPKKWFSAEGLRKEIESWEWRGKTTGWSQAEEQSKEKRCALKILSDPAIDDKMWYVLRDIS